MLRVAREETMTQPDLETDIAALLEETATAHSVYEAESLSGSDDQWPAWYAAYLLEQGLRDRLPRTISGDPDSLATRLEELDAAFGRDDPSGIGVRSTPSDWWPASETPRLWITAEVGEPTEGGTWQMTVTTTRSARPS